MNGEQTGIILGVMQAAWRSRWTQQQEDYWLFELRSYDYDDAQTAIRELALLVDHAPSLREFSEACNRAEANRKREAEKRRALAAGPSKLTDDERARGKANIRKLRATYGKLNLGGLDTRGHNHFNGAADCPVCGDHDHTDTQVVGFTVHTRRAEAAQRDGTVAEATYREPVPMWMFTCPRCGSPDALAFCDTVTPEGAAYLRAAGLTKRGTVATGETF